MRKDRKERWLRELERRLGRLDCLAWTTRQQVLEHARAHLTAGKIAAYIKDRLGFLERWVSPVNHPAFLEVCRELGQMRTKDELERRLGLRSPDVSGWLAAGLQFQQDEPRGLLCVANGWALDLGLVSAEEEAVSMFLIGKALSGMGWWGAVVLLLEGRLGLTDAHYDDPVGLGKHLRETTAGLAPDNAAILAQTLADALKFVGRSGAAVVLLEARLGLTDAHYDDPAGLGKHLRETTAGLAPDNAANLASTLADALRSVGRSGAAAVLLEGRLGLTDAHYADPTGLDNHLQKTTAGLAPDNAANLVSSLADALRFVGRSGAAVVLLEGRLGLTDAHYDDPAGLGKHLQETTDGLAPNNAANLVSSLADALRYMGRSGAAAVLLEGRLGLTDAHYDDPAGLGKHLQETTDGLAPNNAAKLVSTLADALNLVGRSDDAVTLLENHLGLTDAHYDDPAGLGKHLRETTTGLAPDNAASLVQTLSATLNLVGRSDDAVTLLEGRLGLTDAHYDDPAGLGKHLQETTDGLASNNAANLVQTLAAALNLVGRSDDAVTLLEDHLGLTDAHYDDPAGLGKHLRETTTGLAPDNAASLVQTLSAALRSMGRSGAAVVLLEGRLGLTDAHYDDPAGLGKHLQETRDGLASNNAANLVQTLAAALNLVGRSDDAVTLLEGRLGLTDAHYDDPAGLGKHLQETTDGLAPNNAANLVSTLADALRYMGRSGAAVVLLESRLGLTDAHYDDPAGLGKHLRETTTGLASDNAASLVQSLSAALGSMGRSGAAVVLLEGRLGLTGADYADPAGLGEHLRETTVGLAPDNGANLVSTLADALQGTGRTGESAYILDAYLTTFRPLDDTLGPGPENLVLLMDSWLSWFGRKDPQRAQETARRVVPYLRHAIRRSRMSLDDRKRFVQRVRGLRLTLGELAHHWANCAADAGEARHWLLTAQLWDAELGQRVLLERFLLGRILHAGDDGACEPAPRWPFREREQTGAEPPDALQPLAAFDALADGGAALAGPQTTPLAAVGTHPSWLDEAERRVSQGLDELALAQALGPDTLLLRLSVSALDGRLLWAATRSDGKGLEVVAHGGGQPGDQSRLAWSVARHDLRIALAYQPQASAQRVVAVLLRAFVEERSLGPDRDRAMLRDEVGDLTAQLKRTHEGFGKRFEAVCTPLLVPALDLAEQWRATLEALVRTAERPVHDVAPLNAATAEYLKQVERVCDLGTLAEHLGARLDVVVQADDVLHAVPVAHLKVAGRPLWQQVRSVRASLSVLLDVLQRQIEQERRDDLPASRRLMTVSWAQPDDPVRNATQRLHREQQALAGPDRFGLEWRGAAEDPRATPGTLFRGIDGGPLRALTVCGHGDEQQAGVRLAGADHGDSLWSGQGRDLSGVEWLLLVSCSVGRVQGSSVRNVEGLCVELALHRCRSVLAAKWPVVGPQAATVANRVLEAFLELRRQFDQGQLGPDLSDARLRSLALNRARQHLGPNYLNTLAAFELYGLG